MSQSFTVRLQCSYEIDVKAETAAEAVTAALGQARNSDNEILHNAVVTKVEANGWPIVVPWGHSYVHAGF
jgi:hypothetical protein